MTLPEVGIEDDSAFEEMAAQAVAHSKIDTIGFQPLQKEDVVAIYEACMTPSSFI